MNIRAKFIPFVLAAVFFLPGQSQGKGTHFLLEPFTGITSNVNLSAENALGFESGAMFAVGGKLKGFPPRFYLYMKASYANFGSDDISLSAPRSSACAKRSYAKLLGGLRVVIPLMWYIRLNLEMGAGSIFSQNLYSMGDEHLLDYDENLTVMEFGMGLNVRLYSWLSVGLMYDYTIVAEDEFGDAIAEMLGEKYNGGMAWSNVSVTMGLHF